MHHFLLLFWANLDLIPEHYAVMLVRLRVSEPLASAVRFQRTGTSAPQAQRIYAPAEGIFRLLFCRFLFFSAGRGFELGSHLSLVVSSPQLRGIRDGLVALRAPAPTHCRPDQHFRNLYVVMVFLYKAQPIMLKIQSFYCIISQKRETNMINNLEIKFYNLIKHRSIDNQKAFDVLYKNKLYGHCMSVLRQELDSYIRVMFLETSTNKEHLMRQTLSGIKWNITSNGQTIKITDRYMLDNMKDYHMDVWECEYIYKIGCFFIHLSKFHNYEIENPFAQYSEIDKQKIVQFIKSRHGYEKDASQLNVNNVETLIPFLPLIMNKISSNLQCKLEHYIP